MKEGQCKKILIADCKIQMKGGASITNFKNIPDVCENIFEKYKSAKKNINSTIPITRMYVIFNHAIASQVRQVLFRCSRGTNINCRLVSCFEYECLTIEQFRKLLG